MAQSYPGSGTLQRLGIVGLATIEAPIVAALATDSPLLLIGSHGTAKSLLLTRIAAALGLTFRHYNASLLNFDDLVGFPLPGKDGALEYVRTPAAIWGAGAVIFDEISRCRPDIQNKMFPIIHERRVQGIALDGLKHRWAAMNPPSTDDDDNGYLGSEPLDAALADRFPYVVTMPSWDEFTEAEQMAVICAQDAPIAPADARAFAGMVERTRQLLALQSPDFAATAAEYVQTVVALLAQADIALSPRRANMLWRGVCAVNAASLALEPDYNVSDATLVALRVHLPQRAQGIAIPETKLLAAHREAMRTASLETTDPLRAILCTRDPLERLRLATHSSSLPKSEFSNVVADVVAQLQPGAREAAIVHIFETGAVGRLNAAVAAQTGEIYRDVATPPKFSKTVHASNPTFKTWGRVKDLLARLDPQQPRAHLQANAMATLFVREQLQSPEAAEAAFDAFAAADQLLRAS
ncbi:MAG: MoxR-like ATPase [Neolewinella sp.]|jgi:MoxR-like ATPase